MFLSKKNAQYLNKPPKGKKIQPRTLPGWGNDEESGSKTDYRSEYKQSQAQKTFQTNLLGQTQQVSSTAQNNQHNPSYKKQQNKKSFYNWDQLNQLNNIECEKRLVESIVEPVGVKVKPTENLLAQFVKEAKSMDTAIVGSLLLSKIQENYPFLVKAKSLYTIQHLVKKSPAFSNYFKSQTQIIQNSLQPEDNVDNYRKILKNVLNIIGVTVQKNESQNDNQQISFVDPQYNDPKQQPQIKGFLENNQKSKRPVGPGSKKFISPSDAKQGQNQVPKKNDIFDIFQGNQTNAQVKKSDSGLEQLMFLGQNPQPQQVQQPQKNITFDDLLR